MKKQPVNLERDLPHDREAERSVLGAILLNEKCLHDAMTDLVPGDFFLAENRLIYSCMLSLHESNKPIDPVLIMGELEQQGKLEAAGGAMYLTTLPDGLPKATNVPFYAKIVKENSVYRSVIYTCGSLQDRALSKASPPYKVVEEAMELFSALRTSAGRFMSVDRKGASVSLLDRLDHAEDSKALSGLGGLDAVIGGYYPGELVVYVAKPGVGKSFLALQTATTCCHAGQHGLYCSGEMPAEQLMARELVSVSGVEPFKIRRPSQLKPDDFSRLMAAAANECGTCQILSGNLSIASIYNAGRAMKERKELKFVVVDYDELVEVRGAKDEWEAQAMVTAALKSMAMEWLVPVVMISQLRKSLSNEDFPTLDDLYGSGRKAKDASIVIYISRPYVKNLEGDETEATMFILKSRDGHMGKVDCSFNIKTFRFENRIKTPIETIFPEPPRSRKRNRAQHEEE
jgi:replicative DNA helicase